MKKKFLAGLVLLTSVAALAACGTSKSEVKKTSTSESSSKVEKSASSSEKITLQPSTVTYLTDAEIEAMQTAGDYKNNFNVLVDTYVKDFDELLAQLPKEAQDILSSSRAELDEQIAQEKQSLTDQLAGMGVTDETPIPEEGREDMVSAIKTIRDQFQKEMELFRQQAQTALDQMQ